MDSDPNLGVSCTDSIVGGSIDSLGEYMRRNMGGRVWKEM